MDNTIRLPENVLAFARLELQKIADEIEGIKVVVLATEDGFDIVSAVRDGSDPSRIAAMASSISAISTVVSEEANLGDSKNVIINTVSGFAVMQSIIRNDARLVLNAIANEKAVLAHVVYRTSHFANSLLTL
ncbi:MAG: hypothetical protein ABTR07_11025 [Candidatus Competibacter denitrificans]